MGKSSTDTYEFVAIHERHGRAGADLVLDGKPLALRLVPPKQLTGRVLRKGMPAAAIPLRIVPALTELTESEDPLDYFSGESTTDQHGRFVVGMPPRGAGELLIGGAQTGAVRRSLMPSHDLPLLTDMGDIELGEGKSVVVLLAERDECELAATGPMDGGSGIAIVRASRRSPGVRDLLLPEPGRWWLALECGKREVPVDPASIVVKPDAGELTIQVRVVQPVPQ